MADHTPGSWGITKSEIQEFYLDEYYVSADGVDGMVAIVNGEANANRVAAAPDMEKALELVVQAHEWWSGGFSPELMDPVRSAIAKAKGRKPTDSVVEPTG